MEDLEQIRRRMNNKKTQRKGSVLDDNNFNRIYKFMVKAMVLLVLCLSLFTYDKMNPDKNFLNAVFNQEINFKDTTKWVNTQLLNLIPNFSKSKDTGEVSANIMYEKISDNLYKKDDNTITAINSGTVVMVGEQDLLGNYIIVQQSNGVKVTYGNIDHVVVGLYDVLAKNDVLGSYGDNVMMVFEYDGNEISYEEALAK